MWMKFVEIMWIYAFRFNFFLYVIWRFHKTEGEGLLISTKYFLMLLWMAFYWASWRNICSILWCQICVTSLLKVFSLVAELQSGCQVIFDRGYVFLTSLIGGSVGPAQSCWQLAERPRDRAEWELSVSSNVARVEACTMDCHISGNTTGVSSFLNFSLIYLNRY